MAVSSVDLSEEEKYLVALIQDHSGIDLAEFMWLDPLAHNEEKIFRCWDFQYYWWRVLDRRSIDQCGRAIGKTASIIVRAWAFPIQHSGAEMVVTAPELVHLNPLTSRIEDRIKNSRITREMLPNRVGMGFQHRPFQVSFINGAKIVGRIPQKDGKGVKGLHPLKLEQDEAQDYPHPGWLELIETLTFAQEGAQWRAHGVSKGVRDEFYRHSQPNSGWKVFRLTGMHRPDWSDEERASKIQLYGSRSSPDYRRNILGLHGDATNPLFVLHRLMQATDDNEGSEYNQDTYQYFRITDEMVGDRPIESLLDFHGGHKKWTVTWAGMDIGLTNHPSEILVFGEETTKTGIALRLLTRIHLERISSPDQRRVIAHVIRSYGANRFTLDRTGLGLPIYQEMQSNHPDMMGQLAAYAFDEKLVVGHEPHDEYDDPKDYEIKTTAKEFGYDLLRTLVDSKEMILPFDTDLLGEWQGQTWSQDKSGIGPYGKKKYSQGEFHTLDAACMMAVGREMLLRDKITQMATKPEPTPIIWA